MTGRAPDSSRARRPASGRGSPTGTISAGSGKQFRRYRGPGGHRERAGLPGPADEGGALVLRAVRAARLAVLPDAAVLDGTLQMAKPEGITITGRREGRHHHGTHHR